MAPSQKDGAPMASASESRAASRRNVSIAGATISGVDSRAICRWKPVTASSENAHSCAPDRCAISIAERIAARFSCVVQRISICAIATRSFMWPIEPPRQSNE
jgi:hypothetical protein